MDTILFILDTYDWIIYIVGALGILLYLGIARRAYREHKFSIFALEREEKAREARRAFIIMAFFVGIIATTAYINFVVLASGEGQATAALDATQTPTPAILGPTLTPSPTITPTVSLPTQPPASPTPIVTPTPLVSPTPLMSPTPQVTAPDCPNPGVRITSPGMNQVVTGNVPVVGTARIDRFQFYKVEFAPGDPPDEDMWTVIEDVVRQPVENDVLMSWPASGFPSGVYWLRLVVVDETGNFPIPPCRVRVIVP